MLSLKCGWLSIFCWSVKGHCKTFGVVKLFLRVGLVFPSLLGVLGLRRSAVFGTLWFSNDLCYLPCLIWKYVKVYLSFNWHAVLKVMMSLVPVSVVQLVSFSSLILSCFGVVVLFLWAFFPVFVLFVSLFLMECLKLVPKPHVLVISLGELAYCWTLFVTFHMYIHESVHHLWADCSWRQWRRQFQVQCGFLSGAGWNEWGLLASTRLGVECIDIVRTFGKHQTWCRVY